ncbi:MAG: O-antigen ligase family protein [Planctomycetota bacterium]|jgi:tetratricopeptide (TPR) repeat protein
MGGSRVNLYIVDVPSSKFDKAIEWLLISLLAFAPLAFGAVEAWSEEVVVALAAAISISFLLKLVFERNTRLIWSWAYVPIAVFVLIAGFQLIPMPAGAVSVISPSTAAIKEELLGDLPNSVALLKSMTLSFYPNATRHDLCLVLVMAAVFFVVVNVYRRAEQIKRLLGAIAIIGGSLAVLALAQDLFGNGKIYWFVPTISGQAYSGPFVHHSHYGQFMNLSIGAALGLVLVKVREAFTGKKVTPPAVFEYLSSSAATVMWLLVAMIIIGAATVFVSLTRGGMVSLLIAAGFTTLVLASRQSLRGHGWITVLLALGALICVLYIGFDVVYDQLATLRQLHQAEGGRWQILKDVSLVWAKFPILGTGLGTHEVVYPMFDRSTIAAIATHAENEYAQAFEETGLVGLAALASFTIVVWVNYARNVRISSVPICSAACGLGLGLLAVVVHSLSDFGQHLPANAVLSAVSCALLLALARIGQEGTPTAEVAKASQRFGGLRVAALVCVSGVWAWALLGANSTRLAEAHWTRALAVEQNLVEKDGAGSNGEYEDLISNAAAATDYQPDNVKYQHWLNVYRWRSLSRITDPNTGAIILSQQAMKSVRRVVHELHNARLLCPTYGPIYCVVGQLEKSLLADTNGAEAIRKGFRLAPCDPTTCYVAGLLDIEEQKVGDSFEKFNRAVELDGRLFTDIADVYLNRVGRPDLAVALAGDNAARSSYLVNALTDTEEHRDIVEDAQVRVVELLREKCSGPDAPAWALASLANISRREKDNQAAIDYYRRALALDHDHVQWRFELAKLLAETGKMHEAINEASICLHLRPKFKAAEELIGVLSGPARRSD